jgi:hypothetical protein
VATEANGDSKARLLFTTPWDPVVVRRGDALGLRALADEFADAVAPDLSNRVRDGRWVTILAWCLSRSHKVFHASGGWAVSTRAQQRDRYAWLRPLELMWVARTIALAEDWKARSIAGQRSVRPWYKDDKQSTDRFGMSADQFRAYRQTGMYGGYRLAFRKWPGMTVSGDGWTPGLATQRLAKWLDGKLGVARPPIGDADDDTLSARSAKLGRSTETQWWLRQWKTFHQGGRRVDENTLPRRKDDFSKLPEVDLLKPLVFGNDKFGKRRLAVARATAKAPVSEHIELCNHLAHVFRTDRTITLLPRFSRLADAGMAAMDLIAEALNKDGRVALTDVAKIPSAATICKELVAAAREWRRNAGMQQLRHIETAHRFAGAFPNAQPAECLRALLAHHERYGGGLRWFALRNGRIEPRTPPRAGSSRYRFRLWSLCRLATQCGVLRYMPLALRGDEVEEDENSEAADE